MNWHLQVAKLKDLHKRYGNTQEGLLMIAAQLPGGWVSKEVKGLLVKHGLMPRK